MSIQVPVRNQVAAGVAAGIQARQANHPIWPGSGFAAAALDFDFVDEDFLLVARRGGVTMPLARASTGHVINHQGFLVNGGFEEARFHGLRRITNRISKASADWDDNTGNGFTDGVTDPDGGSSATRIELNSGVDVQVDFLPAAQVANVVDLLVDGTYILASVWIRRAVAGSGDVVHLLLSLTGTTDDFTNERVVNLTSDWQRFAFLLREVPGTATEITGLNMTIDRDVAGNMPAEIDVWHPMLDEYKQIDAVDLLATAAPDEWIDRSVTYQAQGQSGLRYFDTANGNSTNASTGVVTASPGSNIPASVKRGFLVEQASTTIMSDTEDLAGLTWTPTNAAIGQNVTLAPDGRLTADRLNDDNSSGSGAVYVEDTASVSTSTDYVISVFAKSDQLDWLKLAVEGQGALDIGAWYDLTNGVVGTTEADILDSGVIPVGNGWHRCWMAFTSHSGDTTADIQVRVADADSGETVALDGTSSIFAWGVMLEANSFPTSYIRNTSSVEGSTVSRVADVSVLEDVTWMASDPPYSLFCDFHFSKNAGPDRAVFRIEGDTNRDYYEFWRISDTLVRLTKRLGFLTAETFSATNPIGLEVDSYVRGRLATLMTNPDFRASVFYEGQALNVDTGTFAEDLPTPPSVETIVMGRRGTGNYLNSTIRRFQWYNEQLSDTRIDDLAENGL